MTLCATANTKNKINAQLAGRGAVNWSVYQLVSINLCLSSCAYQAVFIQCIHLLLCINLSLSGLGSIAGQGRRGDAGEHHGGLVWQARAALGDSTAGQGRRRTLGDAALVWHGRRGTGELDVGEHRGDAALVWGGRPGTWGLCSWTAGDNEGLWGTPHWFQTGL